MRYCALCLAEYADDASRCTLDRSPTVPTLEKARERSLLGRKIGGKYGLSVKVWRRRHGNTRPGRDAFATDDAWRAYRRGLLGYSGLE